MAVFCQNCGKELTEEMVFCPDCGTRRPEGQNENKGMRKTGAGGNIISRIWNSSLFTELAIRFGNILEIFEGILLIIISRFCFQESGFISKALGIFLLLGGVLGCFAAAISLITRKKSDEIPDDVDVRKSKRNLCIGTVVIIIAMIIYKNIGGGTYLVVREVAFDDWGSETIGELIDANMKSPKWSQKKLDKNSKLVYVEGYCPTYGETIQIEFYYEKLKDGSHEVTLKGMKLPESNEEYDWTETAIVWGSFYEHISSESSESDTYRDKDIDKAQAVGGEGATVPEKDEPQVEEQPEKFTQNMEYSLSCDIIYGDFVMKNNKFGGDNYLNSGLQTAYEGDGTGDYVILEANTSDGGTFTAYCYDMYRDGDSYIGEDEYGYKYKITFFTNNVVVSEMGNDNAEEESSKPFDGTYFLESLTDINSAG